VTEAATQTEARAPRRHRRAGTLLAWHGWELKLPPRWNPVRLEGNYAKGTALIADMRGPRLGLRWNSITTDKSFDADSWAKRAMAAEVGRLAADEAQPLQLSQDQWPGSLLYVERKPPGRDVWVARSAASGRLIELILHSGRRERVLADELLPTLSDQDPAGAMRWCVYDFTCTVPAGFRLQSHTLNAGDLTLTFANHRRCLTVRRIAVAQLALRHIAMEGWLARQESLVSRHYRAGGVPQSSQNEVTRRMSRRRRFAWTRWRSPELFTRVVHDEPRDQLIIVQATDETLAHDVSIV
jgi:hypothetical protein